MAVEVTLLNSDDLVMVFVNNALYMTSMLNRFEGQIILIA